MKKSELRRKYETSIYISILMASAMLMAIAYITSNEILRTILLNLSSGFLSVSLLFFLIERALNKANEREDQKVAIILNYGQKKHELPVALRHSDFTRAEILGRIGMIPMKNKGDRFSIAYLSTPEFLEQINQVRDLENDSKLTIPCDEREFNQFDLEDSK